MSAAQPYLHKLRKSQLVEFAEITDLHGYEDYNKPDLVATLDNHLIANRSTFVNDARLSDYYRRQSQPARFGTPAKRAARVEVMSSPAAEESLSRSTRRRTAVRPEVKREETTDETSGDGDEASEDGSKARTTTEESDAASSVPDDKGPVDKTPNAKPNPNSAADDSDDLPTSPAVVTDAIDRQTAVWGRRINDTWVASGIKERSHALRALLSNIKAVETLVLTLEGSSIIRELWPLRFLTTAPAVDAIRTPEFAIKVPDVFILFEGAFWAPFSLWLLTSLALPLGIAYFFNLSLQATQQPSGRGASPAKKTNFDPLSFNIAKSLIVYLVYARQFTFWDVYSTFSVDKVNMSVPGQWAGMLTGTAIGVIGTLYEAILRK